MTHVSIDVAFFFLFFLINICARYFPENSLWNEMKYFFKKSPEEKCVSLKFPVELAQ